MNSKTRFIIALLIALLALVSYLLFIKDTPSGSEEVILTENEGENVGFKPDPRNATYMFGDGPITLSQGRTEIQLLPNSALMEEVFLTGQVAYGDINKDDRNDSAVILVRSGGGSGSFVYVTALVSGNTGYSGSNAILIGDRVAPKNISIASGVITVEYLDRGEDEPFAVEPTIAVTKQYSYRNGELVEN